MPKDQEPEELASISLSQEEIVNRQRPPVGIPRRSAPVESSARPTLLWGLLIVTFVIVVVLAVQLQQVKKQSDIQLQALQLLQQKLTSTDEQANLSVDAIKILLREQDHEIRKLWDLANKKNKKNIGKHKERLDDQSKLITKQAGQIDQVSKRMDGQDKSMKSVSSSMDKLSDKVTRSDKSLKDLKSQIADSQKSVKDLKKSMSGLPKSVASDLKALEKKLKDLTKAVDAIDATRLHHNKRLNKIETQLKASPAPAPAS